MNGTIYFTANLTPTNAKKAIAMLQSQLDEFYNSQRERRRSRDAKRKLKAKGKR